MALIQFDRVSLAFGEHCILDKAAFSIDAGERVCLIGRNGAGKSTLFKLAVGELEPDDGEIRHATALRISRLQQTLPHELDQTVFDYVKGGLSFLQSCIDKYQQLSAGVQGKSGLRELEDLQHLIEAGGGWRIDNQVETILTELQLPAERKLGELSGGWQRRASLGRALISQPELLLLDEPTNHLDLSAIRWLEDRVFAFQGSILFVTHDRAFLQRLATRILELDRGRLSSWPGSFKKFLTDKEKLLEDEARQNALFDKQLQQEESWIRQGIKARRTRNEGRVRALEKMREEYARRVKPQDQVRIHVEEGDLSGRKVIDARKIDYSYGDENLIRGLSLKIQRGDRVGLIGNNGVGKSTLLKILLGEIQPKAGTVKQGTNLQIAYFDQRRRQLDPERTAAEIVGDGSEYIKVNGKEQHIIGYLKGFLFSPERSRTRVKVLSGGECNRIILAKLFTRPSNLLILDEPTNDLDVETLEVLEQRLCEYKGTLIVVSHDREFLDNVVTSTVVFEAGGNIQVYAGGYSDWLKQGKALRDENEQDTAATEDTGAEMTQPARNKPGKLSYKLQRELDGLPDNIELLEKEVSRLLQQVGQQDFYDQPYEACQTVLDQLAERESALDRLLQRWGELEILNTRR